MIEHDRSPLEALTSIAMVIAYINKTLGLDAVHRLLREMELERETLTKAAATLKTVGLTELAEVVAQYAARAHPMPIKWLPFPERMAARRRMARRTSR
jgi:hypothetical protein